MCMTGGECDGPQLSPSRLLLHTLPACLRACLPCLLCFKQILLGPQTFSSIAARLAELGVRLMLTETEAAAAAGEGSGGAAGSMHGAAAHALQGVHFEPHSDTTRSTAAGAAAAGARKRHHHHHQAAGGPGSALAKSASSAAALLGRGRGSNPLSAYSLDDDDIEQSELLASLGG